MIKRYIIFSFIIFFPISFVYSNLPIKEKFEESKKYFESGDYEKAMFGFMDIILEEPENKEAIKYIKKCGLTILDREKEENKRKAREILSDAIATKKELDRLDKEKKKQIKKMQKLFDTTYNYAEDIDKINDALIYYENFLKEVPIYSDGLERFLTSIKAIKEAFYTSIRKKYPFFISGKNYVDERDIATVYFIRDAMNEFSIRQIDPLLTEKILKRAEIIKNKEEEIISLYKTAENAWELYSRDLYSESIPLWEKIIKYNKENEEAKTYLSFAKKHLMQKEKKKEVLTPKELLSSISPGPAPILKPEKIEISTFIITNKNENKEDKKDVKLNKDVKTIKKESNKKKKNILAKKVSKKRNVNKNIIIPEKPKEDITTQNKDEKITENKEKTIENEELKIEEKAQKLYEKGVYSFSVSNYEKAIYYWQECLKLNPKHLKAKLGIERAKKKLEGQG